MTAVASPCVKICTLDRASGLCTGCGRTLDEIASWTRLSPAERTRIMGEAARRLEAARAARST